MKVISLNSRKGNPTANQFIIDAEEGEYLQSYDSIIAYKDYLGNVYLDKNKWDFSPTTGIYRNIFLKENKQATLKKIQSGVYKLVDLNQEI